MNEARWSLKIDLGTCPCVEGSEYPRPYDEPCRQRVRYALGVGAGLTQFGVNLQRLEPGAWSSQRHWHTAEDEFVWVVEGEVVLVTAYGEEKFVAGECAGFPAGSANGHHFQNRSASIALILEIGSRMPARDAIDYPDIDLRWTHASGAIRKNGEPYAASKQGSEGAGSLRSAQWQALAPDEEAQASIRYLHI